MLRGFWTAGGRLAARAFMALTIGAAAWASAVPPAVYSVSAWNGGAFGPNITLHSPGTVVVGSGSATLAAIPSSLIDISGYVDNTYTFFHAGGSIDYYFEFSGPDGLLPVNIDVNMIVGYAG